MLGLVIAVVVLAASVHDNAAGIALLDKVAADTDTVEKALVDQGFKNAVVAHGEKVGIEVEIVERNPARSAAACAAGPEAAGPSGLPADHGGVRRGRGPAAGAAGV